MMRNKAKLLEIGRVARYKSERIAKDNSYFNRNMCGFCARGSAILFYELSKNGIQSTIIEADRHFYVKSLDYMIDITATQFGNFFPKVLVLKNVYPSMSMYGRWDPIKIYYSIEEARNGQIERHWKEPELIEWSDLEH